MLSITFLRSFFIMAVINAGIFVQAITIPDTNAGNLLTKFLNTIESGDIEQLVHNNFDDTLLKEIPSEKHIEFLTMMHRMHGGFAVYKIIDSEENRIEVIGKGNKSNAWRVLVILTNDQVSDKITGIDIRDTAPPQEYLDTLPKIHIKRSGDDNSVVQGSIAEKIDDYMTDIESVGYSGGLIIAQDGEVILAKGYGYADRDHKKIFDRKTVFTIGSITKQFTGAAIVKLESMEKISFHDPITDYFNAVPEDKKGITIHHLLTHTAGFPGAIGDDYEKISRNDFIHRAMNTELQCVPGTRYSYSNVGYSLLGAIIEIVTGQSYELFLRHHVLLPAEMEHTGYVLPEWKEVNIVTGYRGDKKWGKPTDQLWGENGPGWHLKGNGGIMSTLDDMYKWGKAIVNITVFNESEKKHYLTPYVAEGPDSLSYYAYGWVRMKSRRGTDVFTHNGGNPYIQNDMYIYPEDNVIMFITSNNGQFSAIDQSEKILDMIF